MSAAVTHFVRLWERFGAKPESSAPIGIFRILFGLTVAGELAYYSLARPFMKVFYFDAVYHFPFPGWPELPFVNGPAMQFYVGGLGLCFVMLAAGWRYRVVKWLCCLGFGYLFFLERAAYLNHWYLTLLVCVLLLWIPAHRRFSLDVRAGRAEREIWLPFWTRGLFLALTGIVYLMSGLAKIEPDWLSGRTMDMVLQSLTGPISRVPDPGGREIMAAWGVILLELAAWPLLTWRHTRWPMAVLLFAFHAANLWMFTIGFFPLMMLLLTGLFLTGRWPEKGFVRPVKVGPALRRPRWWGLLVLFFALQLFLPLRHHLYPGNTLWTQAGRTFSWDMFLAFKGGEVSFVVDDRSTGTRKEVDPREEGLTWGQANKIFKSPDMILQFAHYLSEKRDPKGMRELRIYARSQCGLNGRRMQPLVHPNLNLLEREMTTWRPNSWVMPLMEPKVRP